MTDRSDLESALAGLAERIEWPAVDVAPRVAAGIAASHSPAPTTALLRPAVAVVAAVIALVLTPWGRSAVAGLVGVVGIEIRWAGIPEVVPDWTIDLGRPATAEGAAGLVQFTVLIPDDSEVGPPAGIFVADSPPGGRVDMLWESTARLAAIGDTGVGMLYTQFPHGDSPAYSKDVWEGTEVLSVTVRGRPGYWIEGAPHAVTGRDDGPASTAGRLAGNVLLWDEEGVTHRLESMATVEEAQRIVGTLRVIGASR